MNYNSNVNQSIKRKFVEREVVTCMSSVVEYILETTKYGYDRYNDNYNKAPFNYDDIENLHIDNSEKIEEIQEKIEELEKQLQELESQSEDYTEKNQDEIEEESEQLQNEIDQLEEQKEDLEREQEKPQEVYEWWEVSSWLVEDLKKKGEVVIPHMNLWGRCTTGQAILLDNVISEICEDMEILEGQKNSWEDRK